MILTLSNTSTQEVDARLLAMREEGGVVALGRVLTLIIFALHHPEEAIAAANDASREHPCRIIVLTPSPSTRGEGKVNAEIRVGADAGASEVIILSPTGEAQEDVDTLINPLLLPDAPIVAWWPDSAPPSLADSLLGRLAGRRISDILSLSDPAAQLRWLDKNYAAGDTDLSWARVTLWRGLVAATLDTTSHAPISARVLGNTSHPSLRLLAGWLASTLDIPATIAPFEDAQQIATVELTTHHGAIRLHRPPGSSTLTLTTPDQPEHHVPLPVRSLSECLVEDLRRLDSDVTYRGALGAACDVEVE